MITTESIRRLLAIADVARDPYAVAGTAAALLAADGGDRFALEQYVRALGALKLTAAAQRLAGSRAGGGGGGERPGDAGITGGGVIAWGSRGRRFAANLRALERRNGAAAAWVAQAAAGGQGDRGLSRFELHLAADGNFQVLDTAQPIISGWLGGLMPHKAATAMWRFDPRETPVPRPLAFDGLGFGWLFLHYLETTANSYLNYSCAGYVLEGDPLALAMLLHMHDLQEVIGSPRTRWFIAATPEEAQRAFRSALETEVEWTIPDRFARCALFPRPALELQGMLKELLQTRERRRQDLVVQNERFYAGKDRTYWQQRFREALAPGAPADRRLRVLGITSRYTTVLQHAMTELKAAADAAGAVMEVVMETDDQSLESPFVERIAALKPDLIVQISRMRYENPQLPRDVPFLCWDQDNLPCMRTEGATRSLDALTYVAGHAAIFGYSHLGWPQRNCIFCHPAGATFRYHAGPVAPDLMARFACDVSYVSNAAAPPEVLALELRGRWAGDGRIAAAFDEAAGEIRRQSDSGRVWDNLAIRALLREGGAFGDDVSRLHEMAMDLHRYADRCFRLAALSWVSRWCAATGRSLRLYGRGWDSHPEFARWAAGYAQQGEELRAIYRASRINLQLIETGFLHARSLDGLAAGGFFLTREVPSDGEDPQTLRDMHLLGQWAIEQRIQSPAELDAAGDPLVQARWRRALAFHPWTPAHALQALKIWAATPHASVAFPMLSRISFRGEAHFAELAERYLADEGLRQSVAAEMRRIVLEQFSHESRWNQFVARVADGLAPHA